jgi:hypothetical protein
MIPEKDSPTFLLRKKGVWPLMWSCQTIATSSTITTKANAGLDECASNPLSSYRRDRHFAFVAIALEVGNYLPHPKKT